ncbi:MAG: leucine-rich repeat protein [Lachnospiraceae bacterium]|nr:leucine-rich repeat protein [Lachnospiraceae bacterium]
MNINMSHSNNNHFGNAIKYIVAGLIALLVLAAFPAGKASADESFVTNPRYMFRDETADDTGLPAYYHKGEKYKTLNELEKKMFDQAVILNMYLTEPERFENDNALSQYISCLKVSDDTEYYGVSCFGVDFNNNSNKYKIPALALQVVKPTNSSGEAISYYEYNQCGSGEGKKALEREIAKHIDVQKVFEAVFVDLPDVFWFDKTYFGYDYRRSNLGSSIGVDNFNFYFARSKDGNGEKYTKDTVAQTYARVKQFARAVIDEVETKAFWETVRAGTSKPVPKAVTDSDKLEGIALLLGKALQYDRACNDENYSLDQSPKPFFGIDCVADIYNIPINELNNSADAVCEGYSELYKFICDMAKFYNPVKVGIEIGYAGLSNESVSKLARHEWNVVTIGGESFVADITNDDRNTYLSAGSNSSVQPGDEYKYNGILFMKGTFSDPPFTVSNSRDYYVSVPGSTVCFRYMFDGDPNDPVSRPVITEAVEYDLSGSDFSDPLKVLNAGLFKNTNEGLAYDEAYYTADGSVPAIIYGSGNGDEKYIIVLTNTPSNTVPADRLSFVFELLKDGTSGINPCLLPGANAVLLRSAALERDARQIPYLNVGDLSLLEPGLYHAYVYADDGSYAFPMKVASFEIKPAQLAPVLTFKDSSVSLTIDPDATGADYSDRFEISLDGIRQGDEVNAQITSLRLINITDSTTEAEGSADVYAEFTLGGTGAANYAINASNVDAEGKFYAVKVGAVIISKKEKVEEPAQGNEQTGGSTTSGGEGTSSGGTTSGGEGTSSGGTTSGGEGTSSGGTTSGGGSTSGGGGATGGGGSGSSGGGATGGSGSGSSGGGGATGGSGSGSSGGSSGSTGGSGAATGGGSGGSSGGSSGSTGGGGAAIGGGTTTGDTDSSKKDDKSAEEKKDDKKEDKPADDKKEDKEDKATGGKVSDDGAVVVENEDGSVTTTTTTVNKKGSVIVESVTENTDGSTVETKIKTTKSGNVTETVARKDAEGNVVSTVESKYSVSKKGTVKMTALETDEKEVEIPETVEVAGEAHPVSQIAKYALRNNKTMTSTRIGENITSIGAGAYKNNKKLKSIELTDSVKKVYKNAFKGIAKNAVFKIKSSSKKKFDKVVALLKASGVSDTVTFEMVE